LLRMEQEADRFQVGRIRKEPQGEVLLHHGRRAPPPREGGRRLAPHVLHHRPLS
jgi:hypothetical protein